MSMFCFQCEEAAKNYGCTIKGVCGKKPEVANLHYLSLFVLKGISYWTLKVQEANLEISEANHFMAKTLFATITNANFDDEWFLSNINDGLVLRDKLRTQIENLGNKILNKDLPEVAYWREDISKGNIVSLTKKGLSENPLKIKDEDIRSLTELIIYGLKGISAYVDHALLLGYESDEIWEFMHSTLVALLNSENTVNSLFTLSLKTGEFGVKVMALLDKANTTTFGHPEITNVFLGVKPGPAILVSGHDLLDLHELLQQTEGKGINIYTHGEMLPANAYPELKKYKHLIGNYGGSWWQQKNEFEKFNGPILMTTNCIVTPKKTYQERIYVTGNAGFPGLKRINNREKGKQKDFSEIIEQALKLEGPEELEQGTIPIGFAHNTVLSVADKVVEAIKSGAIKRFVVMGGCDARKKEREYFTEVAKKLPKDTIILTAGCAKYRYNKLDLGDIEGIPRILDAGQCNDSYSLVVIALKLAEVFEKESINELPISFDLGWYEQKAVLVLLALLHLGVKNIRIGPTLPAFFSKNVVGILNEKLNLNLITTPDEDIAAMLSE